MENKYLTVNKLCSVTKRLIQVKFIPDERGGQIDSHGISYVGRSALTQKFDSRRGLDLVPKTTDYLVVTEDDPTLALVTPMILQSIFPHNTPQIKVGAHGHDLINLATSSPQAPRILILDNDNAIYQGVLGLRDLRIYGNRTPAIIVSGDTDKARREAQECGLDQDQTISYLAKPFGRRELELEVIRSLNRWYEPLDKAA